MLIQTMNGQEHELTPDEVKFYKALRKLEKLKQGRIRLFASGTLALRFDNNLPENEFDFIQISVDGGDDY